MLYKTKAMSLYIIAVLFSGISYFRQVLPANSTAHFQDILLLTPSQAVVVTSLFFIFYALLQIPAGVIMDRFGVKVVLPLGLFLTVVGSILYAVGTTITIIALGRIISGIGCSVAYVSGIFIAVTYLPLKRLPLFIGLVEAVSVGMVLIMSALFKRILIYYGWYAANAVVISFSLVLLILFLFFSRNIEHKSINKGSLIYAIKQAAYLMKNKILLAVFIYSFCTWLIFMSFAGYWFKHYMIYTYNYADSQIKLFAGLYWMTFLIANVIIGFYVDNINRAKRIMLVLSLLSFIDFSCFSYISVTGKLDDLPLLLSLIIAGISTSGVVIAFALVPKIVSRETSGTALAVNNTFIVLGGYVGQVLFGYIVKQNYKFDVLNIPMANQYDLALLIYPFFAFISVIAVLFILKN